LAFECGDNVTGRGGNASRNRETTPGVDFDPERGSSYLKLCYAGPEQAMREAAHRITAWLTRG
jgi:hypothetical protein